MSGRGLGRRRRPSAKAVEAVAAKQRKTGKKRVGHVEQQAERQGQQHEAGQQQQQGRNVGVMTEPWEPRDQGTVDNDDEYIHMHNNLPPCARALLDEDPTPVLSMHSGLGLHVSSQLRARIMAGQYIELAQLLEVQPGEPVDRRLEVTAEGELVVRSPRAGTTITTIESWTSAFLVFTSIFLRGHPDRAQELLQYLNVIRTAASRHPGQGWKLYDQQFRLRFAADPAGSSFSKIDYELWLLYVGVSTGQSMAYGQKKCFDFNYRSCYKGHCAFRHACLACNGLHPCRSCPSSRGTSHYTRGNGPVRAAVARG